MNRLKIKSHPLVVGTVLLTLTGFVTRIIGFFYRIYLSRLFGEEGMGIYQLVSPVLSLSFALTCAGFQTAISKFVAEGTARREFSKIRPMMAGLFVTIPLSGCCTYLLFWKSEFFGSLLGDERCVPLIKILALSIPFAAIHACINGYFYGKKQAMVPAATQLIEQLARVVCVYVLMTLSIKKGYEPDIRIAVWGLTIAEFISMCAAYVPMLISTGKEASTFRFSRYLPHISDFAALLSMALPLTLNRLTLNILSSVESVSIPAMLKTYGYDNATALSVYGVLTGMAMPFIFFPNAITGSISVLLLPVISETQACGRTDEIITTINRTIKYCFILGILFMGIFWFTGELVGVKIYHSALAGYFIKILGLLCPFLYLDSTLSSIIQGLGKAGLIFMINLFSMILRMGFVFFAIPAYGINGYLTGTLTSQIFLCILLLAYLHIWVRKQN